MRRDQDHETSLHHSPPCPGCRLRRDLCLCTALPRVETTTWVSLLIHQKELKRTSNTGRLAHLALPSSEIVEHGHLNVTAEIPRLPGRRPVVLYPSPDAEVLTPELVARDESPLQLIVIDGNWRQAARMARRHPTLHDLPRVVLPKGAPELRRARRETTPGRLATLEAVAYALGILEGPEVRDELIRLFRRFSDGMLCQRGKLRKREVFGLKGSSDRLRELSSPRV